MANASAVNLGMPLTFGKADIDEKTGKVKMQGNVMGVDVQETVDALTEAMKVETKIPQARVEDFDKKMVALSSLESKVKGLYSAAANLRGQKEGSQPAGVFAKFMYLIPNTAAENDVSVDIGDLATEQTFEFRVTQLAKKDSVSSATGIVDHKTDLGWTGNVTIGDYTFTVDGKSAEAIRNEINLHQSDTKATAQLIQSEDGYHFLLSSTKEASPIIITNNIVGAGTQFPSSSTKTVSDLSAKCIYNGLEITSESNTIKTIPNLTLTLKNVSSDNFNVSILHDRASTAQTIFDFVDSYNALQDEISLNMRMNEDGTGRAKDAVLFGDRILNTLNLQTGLTVANGVSGIGAGLPKTLGDLGISMGGFDTRSGAGTKVPSNHLAINTQALYEAINTNYEGVKKVFAFDSELSDPSFKVVKHPKSWPDELAQNSTTIRIARDNSGVLSVTFSRDGEGGGSVHTGTINEYSAGATIIGPKGTPFEDLRLIATDTHLIPNGGDKQTTLKASQGLGDKLLDVISHITHDKTGDFATERAAIKDNKAKIQQKIVQIEKKIESKRDQLLASFQRMQELVNKFLTMQNSLNILLNPGGQG